MALATLARSSLKQFVLIHAEILKENGNVEGEQLEALMWEKILSGNPVGGHAGNKIPSSLMNKLKYDLPYLPEFINYIGCSALKPRGGLYTPCGAKSADGEQHCAACAKHEAKYGTLAERGAVGTYTDPSDKHEITYGTWLAKNETTIEEVNADLAENGFTFQIPSDLLTVNSKRVSVPKRRPGRPGAVKKTKVNADGTESPMGTSLDGAEHVVVVDSDATISSDEEEKPKTKKSPKKAASPEEKEAAAKKKASEKELAKAVADAKKAADKAEKDAKKTEKPKKEKKEKKAEKPKKKTNESEHEEESEEVVIDGTEYMMVGNKLFDDTGTLVGTIENGKATFIHA